MTTYQLPEPDRHDHGLHGKGYTAAQMLQAFTDGVASRDAECEALRADAARLAELEKQTPVAYTGEISECSTLLLEKPFWNAIPLYEAPVATDIDIRFRGMDFEQVMFRKAVATKPLTDVTTKIGWLVENGKQGDQLRYRTWRDGMPDWTADHNEATRYCRRIDAEKAHAEDSEAMAIVEHAWHGIKEQK